MIGEKQGSVVLKYKSLGLDWRETGICCVKV